MATATASVPTRRRGKMRRRLPLDERNDLVVRHLPLVRGIVSNLIPRLPSHVDEEDLLEAGVVGLMHAADRFDPKRQVRFGTYAMNRVRGAVLDALRDADWLSRSMRSEIKAMDQARDQLTHENLRAPTLDELSRRTGVGKTKLKKLTFAAETSDFRSLDTPHSERDADHVEPPADASDVSLHPSERAILEEDKDRLSEAIDELSETDRLVITLYYFEGLRLREIGAVLNVTDSRVCQIHRAALGRLRETMAESVAVA